MQTAFVADSCESVPKPKSNLKPKPSKWTYCIDSVEYQVGEKLLLPRQVSVQLDSPRLRGDAAKTETDCWSALFELFLKLDFAHDSSDFPKAA